MIWSDIHWIEFVWLFTILSFKNAFLSHLFCFSHAHYCHAHYCVLKVHHRRQKYWKKQPDALKDSEHIVWWENEHDHNHFHNETFGNRSLLSQTLPQSLCEDDWLMQPAKRGTKIYTWFTVGQSLTTELSVIIFFSFSFRSRFLSVYSSTSVWWSNRAKDLSA